MSTITRYKCNFCGVVDSDSSIQGMGFMGKKEDYHVCTNCTGVIGNLLYEVSCISMINPIGTVQDGERGLMEIIKQLYNKDLY
jgi:hypothetical protein